MLNNKIFLCLSEKNNFGFVFQEIIIVTINFCTNGGGGGGGGGVDGCGSGISGVDRGGRGVGGGCIFCCGCCMWWWWWCGGHSFIHSFVLFIVL
jgi:hypothetical protein